MRILGPWKSKHSLEVRALMCELPQEMTTPCMCGLWHPSLIRKQSHARPRLSYPIFVVQRSGKTVHGKVATVTKKTGLQEPLGGWMNEGIEGVGESQRGRDLYRGNPFQWHTPPFASLHLSNASD